MVLIGLKVERSTGSNAAVSPQKLPSCCSSRVPGESPEQNRASHLGVSQLALTKTNTLMPPHAEGNQSAVNLMSGSFSPASAGADSLILAMRNALKAFMNACGKSGTRRRGAVFSSFLFPLGQQRAEHNSGSYSQLCSPPPTPPTIKLQPRYDGWDMKQGAV